MAKAKDKYQNGNNPLQFGDLVNQDKIVCTGLPEIALSEEMKEILRKLLVENGYKEVKVFNYTTVLTVESSDNTVYIPNQYFLIAVKTFNYAVTLAPYVSFYVNELSKDVKKKINNSLFPPKNGTSEGSDDEEINESDKRTLTQSDYFWDKTFFSSNKNEKRFISFLNLASKRLTNRKGVDRSPHDIFKSYYLKTIGAPDASSETLAKIVWILTQNMEVYNKLKAELEVDVNAQCSMEPKSPEQIVYYGIPGCGKSYAIKQKLQSVEERFKIRTVFHPEYCNTDFVGQVYPVVKPNSGGVDYRFKPGPFARAIRKAYHDSMNQYYLCIEEINRGNAAAIFGELFQLLDRIGPNDNPESTLNGNCYTSGWSTYGINNDELNDFIREEKERDDYLGDQKQEEITYKNFDWKRNESHVHFEPSTEVRIPPNLTIYATMNTSDQNVFFLDNAFQRRFNLVLIQDKFDILERYDKLEEKEEKEKLRELFGLDEKKLLEQYNKFIGDSGVRWGRFRHWINERISHLSGISKSEDKRLGAWFITSEAAEFPKNDFAEKVFKYLRNDVFKSSVESPFNKSEDNEEKPLSEIIYEFEYSSKNNAFKKVFNIEEGDLKKLKQELKMQS